MINVGCDSSVFQTFLERTNDINIDELTIKEAREIALLFSGKDVQSHSFEVGRNYIIRTLSYHYTGRLAAVTGSDIVLSDAAWVADSFTHTGRWSEALKTGTLSEVEPFPDAAIINRSVIVDSSLWGHDLPRETK